MSTTVHRDELAGLYRDHRDFVRGCLRRFGMADAALDDAVHDVFIELLGRAGESYDRARSIRAWLFGITRNLARSRRRRDANRARLDERNAGVAQRPDDPDEALARAEAQRVLDRFLSSIDRDVLAPFVLVDIEGHSAKDAAERLGLPITTVRWRVRVARAELQGVANRHAPRPWHSIVAWLWPWSSVRRLPKLLWIACICAIAWAVFVPWRVPRPKDVATAHVALADATTSARPRLPARQRPTTSAMPIAESARGSIAGRVLDPSGDGIADAQVCALLDPFHRTRAADVDPICTHTDTRGEYRLAAAPGELGVSATAAGYLPASHAGTTSGGLLRVARSEQLTGIDLVLARGGAKVTGTVLDATGGSVASATIRAKNGTVMSAAWSAYDQADEDGHFEIWVPSGPVQLQAMVEGYAIGTEGVTAPARDVELRLLPEVVLTGVVVDELGGPVGGVLVHATPTAPNALESGVVATTDAAGRFALERLRPGSYRPRAIGEQVFGELDAPIVVAFGAPSTPLRIEVHPATTVNVVIDSDADAACDGEYVRVNDRDARIVGGAASLPGVLPGPAHVALQCAGQTISATVEVTAAEEVTTRLRFAPVATVRGRLIGSDRLRRFAIVVAIPSALEYGGVLIPKGSSSVFADAQGAFVIAVPDGGDYRLHVTPSGSLVSPVAEVSVAAGEHADVGDVRLPETGELRGRVTDPSGAAMPGMHVRGDRALWSETGEDGSYVVADVPVGTYELRVTQRGHAIEGVERVEVSIRADAISNASWVVPARTVRVEGVVVDADGQPIPEASVAVALVGASLPDKRRARALAHVLADVDGAFTLSGLPASDLEVEAIAYVATLDGSARCEGVATSAASSGRRRSVTVRCDVAAAMPPP